MLLCVPSACRVPVVSALRTQAQSPRDCSELVPRHASRQARAATDAWPARRVLPQSVSAEAPPLLRRVPAPVSLRGAHTLCVESSGLAAPGCGASVAVCPAGSPHLAHGPNDVSSSHLIELWPGRERCEQPAQPRASRRPGGSGDRHNGRRRCSTRPRPTSLCPWARAQRASPWRRCRSAGHPRLPATWLRDRRIRLPHAAGRRRLPGMRRDSPATASPARSPSPACARLRDRVRLVDGGPGTWSCAEQQQVLLLVDGGAVEAAIHVSTAAPGRCSTPASTFTVFRKELDAAGPCRSRCRCRTPCCFERRCTLHADRYPDVPRYPRGTDASAFPRATLSS